MSPRAVVPGDHPGSAGRWQRTVESRLERLFTVAATTLRRKVDDGDFIVEGGGDIKILDDFDRVVWSALDGPARTATAQYDSPNLDLPGSWTDQPFTMRVDVPDGYTRAQVLLYASAGSSFTGAGNYLTGVQPLVGYGSRVEGPAISTGGNGAAGGLAASSAVSFMATTLTDLAGGWIALWCSAYASGSASKQSSSGNYHLAASVTFTR